MWPIVKTEMFNDQPKANVKILLGRIAHLLDLKGNENSTLHSGPCLLVIEISNLFLKLTTIPGSGSNVK